jgi:hypothetical protein
MVVQVSMGVEPWKVRAMTDRIMEAHQSLWMRVASFEGTRGEYRMVRAEEPRTGPIVSTYEKVLIDSMGILVRNMLHGHIRKLADYAESICATAEMAAARVLMYGDPDGYAFQRITTGHDHLVVSGYVALLERIADEL